MDVWLVHVSEFPAASCSFLLVHKFGLALALLGLGGRVGTALLQNMGWNMHGTLSSLFNQ